MSADPHGPFADGNLRAHLSAIRHVIENMPVMAHHLPAQQTGQLLERLLLAIEYLAIRHDQVERELADIRKLLPPRA